MTLFLVSILAILLKGFTLSMLWSWFVYGSFTTASLSVVHALGVILTVRLITSQYIKQKVEDWDMSVFDISVSLIALTAGWVIHLFM